MLSAYEIKFDLESYEKLDNLVIKWDNLVISMS